MTKEEFKAKVSMAYHGLYPDREEWEIFLEDMWLLHLQAVPRWISVEDELPERDEDVLILTPQNLVHIAAYKYRDFQTKAHVFASGIDGYSWNNVTHWQHLPLPPKKGGEQ